MNDPVQELTTFPFRVPGMTLREFIVFSTQLFTEQDVTSSVDEAGIGDDWTDALPALLVELGWTRVVAAETDFYRLTNTSGLVFACVNGTRNPNHEQQSWGGAIMYCEPYPKDQAMLGQKIQERELDLFDGDRTVAQYKAWFPGIPVSYIDARRMLLDNVWYEYDADKHSVDFANWIRVVRTLQDRLARSCENKDTLRRILECADNPQ